MDRYYPATQAVDHEISPTSVPENPPFPAPGPPAVRSPARSAAPTWPYLAVKSPRFGYKKENQGRESQFRKPGGCIFLKPGCRNPERRGSEPVRGPDSSSPPGGSRLPLYRHQHFGYPRIPDLKEPPPSVPGADPEFLPDR